jgi:hypothetical protein
VRPISVEIYGIAGDGLETLLHRATVFAINPLGARKQAHHLLVAWKKRRAKSAHVLNGHGEILYKLSE